MHPIVQLMHVSYVEVAKLSFKRVTRDRFDLLGSKLRDKLLIEPLLLLSNLFTKVTNCSGALYQRPNEKTHRSAQH
jgi:hypothetical protein